MKCFIARRQNNRLIRLTFDNLLLTDERALFVLWPRLYEIDLITVDSHDAYETETHHLIHLTAQPFFSLCFLCCDRVHIYKYTPFS